MSPSTTVCLAPAPQTMGRLHGVLIAESQLGIDGCGDRISEVIEGGQSKGSMS